MDDGQGGKRPVVLSDVNQDTVKGAIGAQQPFRGTVLGCRAVTITTKGKKQPFTKCNWSNPMARVAPRTAPVTAPAATPAPYGHPPAPAAPPPAYAQPGAPPAPQGAYPPPPAVGQTIAGAPAAPPPAPAYAQPGAPPAAVAPPQQQPGPAAPDGLPNIPF